MPSESWACIVERGKLSLVTQRSDRTEVNFAGNDVLIGPGSHYCVRLTAAASGIWPDLGHFGHACPLVGQDVSQPGEICCDKLVDFL